MIRNIETDLEKHGFKSRIVSAIRLKELQKEITEKRVNGYFFDDFFRERLTSFKFRPPKQLPKANSLLIAVYPQPKVCIIFSWKGKSHPVLLPPTYMHHPNAILEKLLKDLLKLFDFHVVKTILPLKLLAVRSGLGSYGRNNICYIPKWESFHRLMAFFSDLPCEDDVWFESSMLKECQKCTACIRACPTGAITSERFLIRAERCLTFQNERSGEFPSWVDPSWHHCLFGCMRCQKICPQNKRMLNWIEDREEFTEQETSLILEKVPLNRIPSSTRKKIEGLYMIDEYELLSRNLNSVLMNSLFDKREE